ncbi:peptide/nickel transport system permease protein [Paenibacillus sp. yr247]|uniref:ABC transporter permease n=1 Tax=Paenibacillus sp. yr247 TaxID=1761880 RepID=UPI00087F898F|nr:ABC transporter permease [Paenibacillus sp. yr247]SDO17146.1 peptide/nickel transport system permease protein [Paenibacillus sp. yr247]
MNKMDITQESIRNYAAAAVPRRGTVFLKNLQNLSVVGKIALIYLLLLHLFIVFAPMLLSHSPTDVDPLSVTEPASAAHVLGTDELGRDELARIVSGGQITLLVGLAAMALAVFLGGLLGSVAGFFGGATEYVIMRIVDMMLSIPSFFLILIEITSFGNKPPVVIMAVGLTYWPQMARIVHSEVLKWRNSSLVEAETTLGAGPWRILFRHVIPQTFSSIIVLATLGIGWAILAESGLSYLGLGIQPPLASWGNMLQHSQNYIWTSPVLAIYPGVLILLTVLGYSLLGESLRDVLDPKLKR